MIDFHCHVLPGFDDGAQDLEMSLAMLDQYKRHGVDALVATSHFACGEDVDRYIERRGRRIKKLREAAEENDIEFEIFPGAEVLINDDLYFMDGIDRLCANNSRYLLCEFPFYSLNTARFRRYLEHILNEGLIPVVAHPERYTYLYGEYELISELGDWGVLFQNNASGLFAEDGAERAFAREMVDKGISSIIASDAHSTGNRLRTFADVMHLVPPPRYGKGRRFMTHGAVETILNDEDFPEYERGVMGF